MKYAFIFFLLLPLPAWALFCPNGFTLISPGDTVEQVTKACGTPDKKKNETSKANLPQEWSYYVKSNPSDPTTVKMTIAFNQNRVINMAINGVSLTTTTICGPSIQVGSTQNEIERACGKPVFIQQSPSASDSKPTEIDTLTYGSVNLIFENGKLTTQVSSSP